MTAFKRLVIKLGGQCNLHCPHCHCSVPEYKLDPYLIEWIQTQPIDRITFNGGEPLMYFDTIKRIVNELGCDRYSYKFVTNGTLLDANVIDYCNDHDITIILSYDGEESTRDRSFLPRWELMRFIRKCSLSVYTSGSKNCFSIQSDLKSKQNNYKVLRFWNNGSVMPNFLHETSNADVSVSMDDVKEYLRSLAQMVELQLIEFLQTGSLAGKQALVKSVSRWLKPKQIEWGVACCNSAVMTVALDGRFMVCPYRDRYFGDIRCGPDIEAIESLIPKKCRVCPIFDICRNTCIENVTNHECYIARKMHAHFRVLEQKYGVDLLSLLKPQH